MRAPFVGVSSANENDGKPKISDKLLAMQEAAQNANKWL